ncbi:MAG: hypothetical protein C0497_04260 [Gemmatimonas sp.]|nr:hypothetical protein [Gemmatimonas sp.]
MSGEAVAESLEKVLRDTAKYAAMLARDEYVANFSDKARGVDHVVLPLGNPDAITRLLRDLEAWGFGMGQAAPESSELLSWAERATAARNKLMAHFDALTSDA